MAAKTLEPYQKAAQQAQDAARAVVSTTPPPAPSTDQTAQDGQAQPPPPAPTAPYEKALTQASDAALAVSSTPPSPTPTADQATQDTGQAQPQPKPPPAPSVPLGPYQKALTQASDAALAVSSTPPSPSPAPSPDQVAVQATQNRLTPDPAAENDPNQQQKPQDTKFEFDDTTGGTENSKEKVAELIKKYPTPKALLDAQGSNDISRQAALDAITTLKQRYDNASPEDKATMEHDEDEAIKGAAPKRLTMEKVATGPPTSNEAALQAINDQAKTDIANGMPAPVAEAKAKLAREQLLQQVQQYPQPKTEQPVEPTKNYVETLRSMFASGFGGAKIPATDIKLPNLIPNDIASVRDKLKEQLQNGDITQDQYNKKDGLLLIAQKKVLTNPAFSQLPGIGASKESFNAQFDAKAEVLALIDEADPEWSKTRSSQAAIEFEQAKRNFGTKWDDFRKGVAQAQQISTKLEYGQPLNAKEEAKISTDPNLYRVSTDQIGPRLDSAHKAYTDDLSQYIISPKTLKKAAEATKGVPYSLDYLQAHGMAPKPGAMTGLPDLAKEAIIQGVSMIPGTKLGDALAETLLDFISSSRVGGAIAGTGEAVSGVGKFALKKPFQTIRKYAPDVIAAELMFNRDATIDNINKLINDPEHRAEALKDFGIGLGLGTLGVVAGGRIQWLGNAIRGAGKGEGLIEELRPRIPLARARAVGTGAAEGERATIPFVRSQPLPVQAGTEAIRSYVHGAVQTIPGAVLASALSGGNSGDLANMINEGGLMNTWLHAPLSFTRALRGSTLDRMHVYRGEDPKKLTDTDHPLPRKNYGSHPLDALVGDMDTGQQMAERDWDPSRKASYHWLQDSSARYGQVRVLNDADVDTIAAHYGGSGVSTPAGFIVPAAASESHKFEVYLKANQFDTAAFHEVAGHMPYMMMHPLDQAKLRHFIMSEVDPDKVDGVITNYINRANPGMGKVTMGMLPDHDQITPGNPRFDPLLQHYSQYYLANLSKEKAQEEIAAEMLGSVFSGQTSEYWLRKNPTLYRRFAYFIGKAGERIGVPMVSSDVDGPIGVPKHVTFAAMTDQFLREFAQGKIPFNGRAPEMINVPTLRGAATAGRPFWKPGEATLTAARTAASLAKGAIRGQAALSKRPEEPPAAPGGFEFPEAGGGGLEMGKVVEGPSFGAPTPTTPTPKAEETKAKEGGFEFPDEGAVPGRHIDLSERLPGAQAKPIVTPQAEKKEPVANQGQQEKAPEDESIQGQTQKVTATEFGWIDRKAVAKHPEKYPSGNKGYPDFGAVDLSGENAEGVSLPPEDINKQMGNVMHKDANGVWHADPQFAQDVRNHKIMIEVTNPETGKKAMAPLIDIGPMKSTGAGIDVLHKTAQDVGFTSGKATLHYRIAGGHTADTAPETVGPNEVAQAALDNVGKLNTTQDAGTNNGELACADAVVRILRDQMHLNVPRTLATAELYDYMREPKNGWKSVPLNTPGAVIISPTQGGAHGHVGIVGKDGKVYSNSSSNGNWGQNYTTESWSQRFSSLGMYAFVPTDQVGRVKPGEEGEVAKEGGGGGKGKGSPTDILTGMGDEATAAGAAAAGGEIPPLWKPAAGAPQGGVQYPVEQPQGGAAGAGAEQVPAQQYYGGGGYGGGGGYRPMPAAAAEEYVGGGGGGGFGGGGASVRFMPGAPGGKGRRQVGGIPLEGGEEGDTSGVPNPGGDLVRSHLATGNLSEAVKAHAQSLSGNDTRVKKQADNLFKGEHFQAGDQLHTHVLSNVPDHEKQVLSQAQNAIANKTAMHVAYVSAPKEGLEPVPTTRSRQVEYGMSSPQARILGQAKAQIAGHSFIPTSIGVSLAKKRGDPHQGYIQGISTNAAANNHHHLNSELTSMGQQSPYPQLDEKFNRDLHGYVSNLNAGHKGTGEGPAEGTEQYPNSFDETHVPHRLKRNEADFINAVINNQAAKAKSAEGLRELAKKGGTLLSEEGETNPIRHAIDMRQAGIREELARHPNNINNPVIQKAAQRLWSQDTLEPTIRSFKAGLVQHVHEKPEDLEEGIRPGQEFKGLTEALQRAHEERLGRPDVPTSVSFMPGKASPAALLRNRAINNIERDYAEGRAEEPEVHEKLQSIGEDPSRYRFLEKHGLVSPHEERPEALTVEEHGQLTSNLRQQWISGKLSTKEYRSRIAELPLPEKPSGPIPPTATPPEESPAPSAVAFMPGKAKAGVLQKPDWETANEATRQKYLKTRVKQILANQSTDESAIPLKALKNDDGSYKYDPQGNPTFDKPGYNIVNSPLLKKKGLDQLDDADNHEDTIDPEQHGHLNFTERRRLSALRHASAVETMGNRILKSYNAIKDIPEIAAGKGWYSSMRDKLSKALGPDNEIFAQLLGATSAKTPVRSNFIQALDAYEQWKRGDFDRHAQKYLEAHHKMEEGDGALTQHMRNLGILGDNDPDHKTEAHAMAHWIEHHDILPKQQTGAKYNANSNAVLKVLAGTWLKEADAPKTPNFAGNLTGRTKEATIDVWAARHIKRLGHEGLTGGKPWRDQAKGESGVSGLDFAFGQDAMRHAADKIGINPDDLQAILWYAEKHHYEQQGWTRGEGAKKASFDDVFDKVFHKSGEPMSSKELRDHYAEEANVARKLAGKVKTARKYHEAGSPKLAPYMEKHGLTQEHLGAPEEEEEEAA